MIFFFCLKSSGSGISLWLSSSWQEPKRKEITGIIDQLQVEGRFEPHVTLLGLPKATLENLEGFF